MNWQIVLQLFWDGLIVGVGYVLFATGLTLAFGTMRIINMAHGELYMLGGILLYSIMDFFGLNYFLGMAIVLLIASGFGIAVNRIVITPFQRTSPLIVLLSTLALSTIMVQGALIFWGVTPRRIRLPFAYIFKIGDVAISSQRLVLLVIGTIAIVLFYIWLKKARIGKAMRATAQNSKGASLCGINVIKIYDYTMAISTGLAALTGMLVAPILSASPRMGLGFLLTGFVIAVVGGLGNIGGTIIMGMLIGMVETFFGNYISTYYNSVFIYAIMIFVLLIKPEGIFVKKE